MEGKMKLRLKRIQYSKLNPKQKEIYNFQRLSAILAEFGYMTYRLGDDWQGADFIAQHVDGKTFIKVQLKMPQIINNHILQCNRVCFITKPFIV